MKRGCPGLFYQNPGQALISLPAAIPTCHLWQRGYNSIENGRSSHTLFRLKTEEGRAVDYLMGP